jgi:hypothetical protein
MSDNKSDTYEDHEQIGHQNHHDLDGSKADAGAGVACDPESPD